MITAYVMDPALDVLNRALAGDHGAHSFLDRTSSIYVLDATDPNKPKTYGGWNFIHQALNEIERHEAVNTNNGSSAGLTGHVQLLTILAERVARRSPSVDRTLLTTCIANASQGNQVDTDGLIALNAEIREIVMGRLAAMAFDFSFHNLTDPQVSAFSNPVAMEKLCAVLAANAVSSGPQAVQHFMVEWVIPSVRSLPPYSVASVTCHLAIEALRKGAPAGTRDVLQRLSQSVVAIVLAPVLVEAVSDGRDFSNSISNRDQTTRVAAVSLRALERWCTVTDMSLPQVKHICVKVKINIVEVISDALYSDSHVVVDAMAELLEVCLVHHGSNKVSNERMTQARYIMEIDEEAFRSVSAEDLFRIESKEMYSILGELVAAVGLQRFRFIERQSNGDNAVCRNLTRIAASVGSAAMVGLMTGQIQGGGTGILDLLMKAAAHPSIGICGMALEVLSQLVPLEPGFPLRLLPVLQHRAIVPHIFAEGAPTILAAELCGVDFHEFERFRESTLTDALQACFHQNPAYYLDSCTSAIEEFCMAKATVEVSFQLEAALYCLSAVALEVLISQKNEMQSDDGQAQAGCYDSQLSRCTHALGKKPVCITANPLTLAQLNRFLRQYGGWFVQDANAIPLSIGADLALSTFTMAGTAFAPGEPAQDILREMSSTPFSEAAEALRIMLCRKPKHFVSQQALSALGGGWESSYAACNRAGALSIDDRIAFATGVCHVFASLPSEQRKAPYHSFSLPTLNCMKSMLGMADKCLSGKLDGKLNQVFSRMADEITLLSSILMSFQSALTNEERGLEPFQPTEDPRIALLHEAWPLISHAAQSFGYNKTLSVSLGKFLATSIPKTLDKEEDIEMLGALCSFTSSLIGQQDGNSPALLVVFEFGQEFMQIHGKAIDLKTQILLNTSNDSRSFTPEEKVAALIETLVLSPIHMAKSSLGSAWNRPKEQGQGQISFEVRSKPRPDQRTTSPEALTHIYSLLETCARHSPFFLTHLPSAHGMDRDVDPLLNAAVESAVSSIVDEDVEVCRNALLFLKSTVEILATHVVKSVEQQIVERVMEGARQNIVSMLVAGACGGLHPTTLDPGASLLYSFLRLSPPDATEMCCEAALLQSSFKLGNASKEIVLAFLLRCSKGNLPSSALMILFDDLWKLHQVEENASISESDVVLQFAEQYMVL